MEIPASEVQDLVSQLSVPGAKSPLPVAEGLAALLGGANDMTGLAARIESEDMTTWRAAAIRQGVVALIEATKKERGWDLESKSQDPDKITGWVRRISDIDRSR